MRVQNLQNPTYWPMLQFDNRVFSTIGGQCGIPQKLRTVVTNSSYFESDIVTKSSLFKNRPIRMAKILHQLNNKNIKLSNIYFRRKNPIQKMYDRSVFNNY